MDGIDKIKQLVKQGERTIFNKIVLDETYKAQQKYGFKIGTGEHGTWNNDSDAFPIWTTL